MKRSTKLRLVLGASVLAMTATLAFVDPALAANDTATLQGHAAPGSTVAATDTVTGQTVTVTAGADGQYVIVGLRPSNYHVVSGSTAEDITLAIGETSTLDLAAPAESTTVTVVGRRRTKEVRTAEIATSVSPTQMENLPQNNRNFLNFAALAPGVTVTNGNKQFQAGGVGPDQVNVYIDGQSFKNQSSHGGVAGQAFTPGNPFPQLAVQEFKVSTQNFKAEYEQAGSAIITAVTKTGGSEFHGTIFDEYQNKDMVGQPYFDRLNGLAKPDYKRSQYGFDLGGPIIKNKLHFYVSAEVNDTVNPSTAVNLTDATIPQSIKTAENGSFGQAFKETLWFGKLTWYATDADTINLSGFNRKEDNAIDFGGLRTRSEARNVNAATKEVQVEWNHRGDNYLNEFSLAYQESTIGTPDLTEGPEIDLTRGYPGEKVDPSCMVGCATYDGGTVANMGAQNFIQNSGQKLTTLKDNITFTSFDWHGSHVIKAGVKVAGTELSRNEASQFDGTYRYDALSYNGTSTDTGTSTPWHATINLKPSTTFTADDTQVGLFIQDDWTVDNHLTVNAGVRWDYESNMNNNKYVTPQAIVNALASYTNWQAAGIDYHDYVSTGSNRHAFTGGFAPRLGISYDVHGDRDLVFFAGWGRYYDRNVFLTSILESVTNTVQQIVDVDFCGPGTGTACAGGVTSGFDGAGHLAWNDSYKNPDTLRAALAGQNGSVWLLNNKTKTPYSDDLDLGFRKRLGAANLTVSVQHNMSYNGLQYVRGNRMPDGSYSPAGYGVIIDNFPPEGQLPGYSGKLDIGMNNGQTHYNALFVTLEKPFTMASNYGYTASLTLTDSKTVGSLAQNGDEFYEGGDQRAFGYEHTGGVDKMRFVGTGIVRGPWQTTISGTLTLASGPAYGQFKTVCASDGVTCYPSIDYNGNNFPKDKLAYQNLDLRIAKDFTLPNGNVVTVDGQVYNVFDHVNRLYDAWGGRENSTVGNARSFQVGLQYKF